MKIVSVLLLAILFFGCGGYKSPTQAPPQAAIVPVVTAIMPNSANAGAPGFTLRDDEPAHRRDPGCKHRHGWHGGGHGN